MDVLTNLIVVITSQNIYFVYIRIITLYTFGFQNVICQLHLNKAEKKKEKQTKMEKNWSSLSNLFNFCHHKSYHTQPS